MEMKNLKRGVFVLVVLISTFCFSLIGSFAENYVLPLTPIDYYNRGLELLYTTMPSSVSIFGDCIDVNNQAHKFKINKSCITDVASGALTNWKSEFISYQSLSKGTYYLPIYAVFVSYNATNYYHLVRIIAINESPQFFELTTIPRIELQGRLLNVIVSVYNPPDSSSFDQYLIGFFMLSRSIIGPYAYRFYHTRLEKETVFKNQVSLIVDLNAPTIDYSTSPEYSDNKILDALDYPLFDSIKFKANDTESYVRSIKIRGKMSSNLESFIFEESDESCNLFEEEGKTYVSFEVDNESYVSNLYHNVSYFYLKRDVLLRYAKCLGFDKEEFSNSELDSVRFDLSITVIATDKYHNKREETFDFSYYIFKHAFLKETIPSALYRGGIYVMNASEWEKRDERLKVSFDYDFRNLSDYVRFNRSLSSYFYCAEGSEFCDESYLFCNLCYNGYTEDDEIAFVDVFEEGEEKYNYKYLTDKSLQRLEVFLPLIKPNSEPAKKLSLKGEYLFDIFMPFGTKTLEDSFKLIFDNESPKIGVYLDSDTYSLGSSEYGILHPGMNVGYSTGSYGLFKIRFEIDDDLLIRGYDLPYLIKLEGDTKYLNESSFVCNSTFCVYDLSLLNESGERINSQTMFDETYGDFKDLSFNITVIDPSGKKSQKEYHIYVAKKDPILASFDFLPSRSFEDNVEDYYNMPSFDKIYVKIWDHFSNINVDDVNLTLYYTLLNDESHPSGEMPINPLDDCESFGNVLKCELSRAELFYYLQVDSKFELGGYNVLNYSLVIEGNASNDWGDEFDLYENINLIIYRNGSIRFELQPKPLIYGRFFIYNDSAWNLGLVYFNLNEKISFLDDLLSEFSGETLEYFLNASICGVSEESCVELERGTESWKYDFEYAWENKNLSVNISIPTHSKTEPCYMSDNFIVLNWNLKSVDSSYVFSMRNYVLFDKDKPNLSVSVVGDRWGSKSDVGVVWLGENGNIENPSEPMGTFELRFTIKDDLLEKGYSLPYLITFNDSRFFDESSFVCYFEECLFKIHLVDPETGELLYSNDDTQYKKFLQLYNQTIIPLKIELIDPSGKHNEVNYTLKVLDHDEIYIDLESYPLYNDVFIDGLDQKVFSKMIYRINTTYSKLEQVILSVYYEINDNLYMKEFVSNRDLGKYYEVIFDHDMLLSLYNFSEILGSEDFDKVDFPLTLVLTVKNDLGEIIERSKTYSVELYRKPYQKLALNPPGVFVNKFLLMNSSEWSHDSRLKLVLEYDLQPIFDIMNFTDVKISLYHEQILGGKFEIGEEDYNFDYEYSIDNENKLITISVWLPFKNYEELELNYTLPYLFRIYFVNNFGCMIDDFYLLFDFDNPILNVFGKDILSCDGTEGCAFDMELASCDGKNYCVLVIGKDINISTPDVIGDFTLNFYLYDDLLFRREESLNFSYLVNIEGDDSRFLSQNGFIMRGYNLTSTLYLTNDSFGERAETLTEFLDAFKNRVLHLFFNVVDAVGKRENFEYLLYVLDETLIGDEPIPVNMIVNRTPFDISYEFANLKEMDELKIENAWCTNDYGKELDVSWNNKILYFSGTHTGFGHFDCTVEWNAGFSSKLSMNILVDTDPPKLKLISSKIQNDSESFVYDANRYLEKEDYVYLPKKDNIKNILRFEVSDDHLDVSLINISVDGIHYETFENVGNSYKFNVELDVNELTPNNIHIVVSDKVNNTITYIVHLKRYDFEVDYVSESINSPSNQQFYELLESQDGCDLAYRFKWAQDDLVNLLLHAEDLVLNSDDLMEILTYSTSPYSNVVPIPAESGVDFNVTLYNINSEENHYQVQFSDVYGISRTTVCLIVDRLSDENVLLLNPIKFSELPKNITFIFNKPVDYCEAKIKAYGTEEPSYTFILTPVSDNRYQMIWLNSDEGLKQAIRFEHENMQYVVDVNCKNYYLNKDWNFVSYFIHDSALSSASFEFENVLVKDSWQKMSYLISHPNNPIMMRISSEEPLRCWYFIDNVLYENGSDYLMTRNTIFNAPNTLGVHLIPVFCEDESGNEGLYHIIFLNITNTPYLYKIKRIYSSSNQINLEIITTQDGVCEYQSSGVTVSRDLEGAGILKTTVGLEKTSPYVTCSLVNGHSFTIDLSSILNDNFFSKVLSTEFSQEDDYSLMHYSIYRPTNLFAYVANYEEINLILRNFIGNANISIPAIPEEVSLITEYLDLISADYDQEVKSIPVINNSLVSGIILHPKDLFLYPYVVFELFAENIFDVFSSDIQLKLDGVTYDLSKCSYIVSDSGAIFSCNVEDYSPLNSIQLFYKGKLLDEKQVPKSKYFAFNLIPGSYRYRIFDVGMNFNGRNYVSEPRLISFESGTDNIKEVMLGDYVTYFTYNQSTDEFEMEVVYRLDFSGSVSEGEQKKFVVIAESYPYVSNVVPLFIDLRAPKLER